MTRVTATKGNSSDYSICAFYNSSNQPVTIGSVETGFIRQWCFTTFPYFVAFDANGGTGEQADAQPYMYNVAQPLWSNIFTCTGYTFDGWATTPDGPKAYDNHQTVSNLADTIATVTLYARWKTQKAITGYGTGNSGWQLIASPMADAVTPTASNGFLANTYDLYYFDQTGGDNGKEWKNYKAHCNDAVNPFNALVSGKGYLYANSGNVTLIFNGTPYSGNGQVTLTKTNGYDFSGWNLIGNPFGTAATLNKPFYRMNSGGTALTAQVEANNSVAAMEGVFVQASTNNETASFTPVNNSKGGEKSAVAALNISLSKLIEVKVPEPVEGPIQNNGVSTSSTALAFDNAIVRFDGGQTLEKYSFRKGSTKIYIPQDGTDYAIVSVGRDGVHTVSTEMPLNFKASENGTYTITVNTDHVEMSYLHLIDNMTGADVDLLAPNGGDARPSVSTYTFTAKTTDYESRFKLVFAVGSSTGSDTFAFFCNGNIIINGEGTLQVIDMTGRIVLSIGGHTRCVPTTGMTAGVYVLRLINGDNVRTQKIVVE